MTRVSAAVGVGVTMQLAMDVRLASEEAARLRAELEAGRRGGDAAVQKVRAQLEAEVAAVLDWCGQAQVAVVPFGGGTSVVGGVEPAVGDRFVGVVALDLGALAGVAEVDPVGRAARVLAGTTGPDLEAALGRHGLTFRFFPQSFERSTVGGWLATRAAGTMYGDATSLDLRLQVPRSVTVRAALRYRVTLANRGNWIVPLRPCPNYTVTVNLLGPGGHWSVHHQHRYGLSCGVLGGALHPGEQAIFELVAAIPTDARPGRSLLSWMIEGHDGSYGTEAEFRVSKPA